MSEIQVFQSVFHAVIIPLVFARLTWHLRSTRPALTLLLAGLMSMTVLEWITWLRWLRVATKVWWWFYFSPVTPFGISMAFGLCLGAAVQLVRKREALRDTSTIGGS